MTLSVEAPAEGEYVVGVNVLRASSYGLGQFALDGERIGEAVDGWAAEVQGPDLVTLGRRRLKAGEHLLTLEMQEPRREEKGYYLGIAGVLLQPGEGAAALEARPFLSSVRRLECSAGESGELEPVGLEIGHADGTVDYVFSGGLRDGVRVFSSERGPVEVGGALAYMRVAKDSKVLRAVLHGADWLKFGEFEMRAEARAWEGEVTRVDEQQCAVHTSVRLPADGSLDGQMAYFVNDAYSRTTAYRLERVEAEGEGSVLYFGDSSFVIGRGQVAGVTDEKTMLSSIPHEYACPLGSSGNSKFFDGKLVTSEGGAETRLTSVEFGNPMILRVENNQGFGVGETIYYQDVQAGDRVVVPVRRSFRAGEG
jgi:hypothetical protein